MSENTDIPHRSACGKSGNVRTYRLEAVEYVRDPLKQKKMKNLYEDSILKGVSVRELRNNLTRRFNTSDLYVRKKK